MRRYFHRKINRWNAATNLLLVEKRQEALREYQREKREYVKRKESFWIEGGKQEAAKKVPRISTVEPQQNETTAQQETLSLAQLKKNESHRTSFHSNWHNWKDTQQQNKKARINGPVFQWKTT